MTGYSAQGQIPIKRARKGDNGHNGVTYEIRTSVEQVRCSQDGTPSIQNFTAQLYYSDGASNAVNISATFKLNDTTTVGTGTSVAIPTASGTSQYVLKAYVNNELKAVKCVGIYKDGGNTANVMLFRRSASALTDSDRPTGTLTYTFSTKKLSGTSSYFNSWTQQIPADNGNPLYVTVATAFASGDTDTIAKSEWSTPVLYTKDGLNVSPVFLYKRGASAPAKPNGTLTYTFSTGLLSGSYFNGWSQQIPATDGNPCWVIQATAASNTATDMIAKSEWSEQRKLVEDGADGKDGKDGADGADGVTPTIYFLLGSCSQLKTTASRSLNPSCTVTAYSQKGNNAPVALTNSTSNTIKVTGYNASNQSVYVAETSNSASFNANSRTSTSYGYAIRFEVELTVGSNKDRITIPVVLDGADGADGEDGEQGIQGYNGCVPRLFDVGLVAGQTYYCNDSVVNRYNPNILDADGIRHLDAVAVLDSTMQSGYAVYQCKRNYTATQNAQTKAEFESITNWSTYFVKVSENAASAYFTYLMAQNAFIKMLAGAMMVVQDSDGNVVGGMQGNANLPIFWAGAQLPANGLWQQMANGFASYGTPNKERIELDPVNKTITFFNSSGQIVTEHNARTYSTLASLIPSAGTFSVNTESMTISPSVNVWYGVQDTVVKDLSNVVSVSSNGQLKINYTRLQVRITTPKRSGSAELMSIPNATIRLVLYGYSDSTGTTQVSRATLRQYTAYGMYDDQQYSSGYYSSTSDSVTTTVVSGRYYKLKAELISIGGGNSTISTVVAYVKMTSASIVADNYLSRFFGNGIVLSKSTANYFAAMLESGSFRMCLSNSYYGLDVKSDGMYAKRGDYWHKQPITLMALRITMTSSTTMNSYISYNGVNFILNSSSPTATSGAIYHSTNQGGGQFTIYYPTNWRNYELGSKGFVQATVYHHGNSGDGYLCYVQSINNNYVEIWTADDWTSNWGSVYVELKMF